MGRPGLRSYATARAALVWVMAMCAMAHTCVGAGAPKWTHKFAELALEHKALVGQGIQQEIAPLKKEQGLLFGGKCVPNATEPESVVLFRVPKDALEGRGVTKATLSLHVRRYDIDLNEISLYFLNSDWDSNLDAESVMDSIRDEQPFLTIDVSSQDRGTWKGHELDVTEYASKLPDGDEAPEGIVFTGLSNRNGCMARGFTPAGKYSASEGIPKLKVEYWKDDNPPVAFLDDQPPPLTNARTATLKFSGVDPESGISHFKCKLDGGAFHDCSSPWEYRDLEEGNHVFSVKPVDNHGNVGPEVVSEPWYIDTQLPEAFLVEGEHPNEQSSTQTATFVFTTEDNVVGGSASLSTECKVDDGAYVLCYSGSPVTFADLGQGPHAFYVRVHDVAGNVNEIKLWSWVVDIPPECKVRVQRKEAAEARANAHASASAGQKAFDFVFAWSESVRGFAPEGVVVGGVGGELKAWHQVNSTHYQASCQPLTDGDITIQVKSKAAQDDAGNWNVLASNVERVKFDGTAPRCSIQARHPGQVFSGPFPITIVWTEDVRDFSPASVVISSSVPKTGAKFESKFSIETVGSHFTGTIVPYGIGPITIGVKAKSVYDISGNANGGVDGSAWSCTLNATISNTNVYYALKGKKALASVSQETLNKYREVPSQSYSTYRLPGEAGAVEIDANNHLFVAVDRQSVYMFEASRAEMIHTLTDVGDVVGLKTDASGHLYVVDGSEGVIRVFKITEDAITPVHAIEVSNAWSGRGGPDDVASQSGSESGGSGGVSHISLAFDFSGNLLVLNPFEAKVHIFDSASGWAPFATVALDPKTSTPVALAVDGRNVVNVLDRDSASLHAYPADFSTLNAVVPLDACRGQGGRGGVGSGGWQASFAPTYMAMDLGMNIHVLTEGSDTVCIVDTKADYDARPVRLGGGSKGGGRDEIVALASYHEVEAPQCTITAPEGNQHATFNVTFQWNRPVVGFDASDVLIGGAGGSIIEFHPNEGASDESASAYTAVVVAGGIGTISVRVASYAAQDAVGIWNPRESPEAKVTYFGGQCSVELGCRWQLAQYESQLALDRVQQQIDMELEKEEKAASIREEARIRAETEIERAKIALEKQKLDVEIALMKERVRAEANERIRESKLTEDIRLREIREKGYLYTEAALKTVGAVLTAAHSVFSDPQQMSQLVKVIASLFLAYFLARECVKVTAKYVSKMLGKPSLLRETSRGSLPLFRAWKPWKQPARVRMKAVNGVNGMNGVKGGGKHISNSNSNSNSAPMHGPGPAPSQGKRDGTLFDGIILCEALHTQMRTIAHSILNRKRIDLPYRHMLFHGLPGTGKTMVAERLARKCGMDYAIMSGGDVVPLGKTAVTELHALFNWAERSRKGVLIFIDEAEAFLQKRGPHAAQSEYMKAAINALLSRTGRPSKKYMLVLASNRPQELDSAVLNRIDDTIHFPLPTDVERGALLRLYFRKYIGSITKATNKGGGGGAVNGDGGGCADGPWESATIASPPGMLARVLSTAMPALRKRKVIRLVGFSGDDYVWGALTRTTEGFSGREIAKLISSVATYALRSDAEDGSVSLSWADCISVVERKAREHADKAAFIDG